MQNFKTRYKKPDLSNIPCTIISRLIKIKHSKINEPITEHVHQNKIEIIYCLSGTFNHYFNNTLYTIHGNDLMVVPSGSHHKTGINFRDRAEYYVIQFDPHLQNADQEPLYQELLHAYNQLDSLGSHIAHCAYELRTTLDEIVKTYASSLPVRNLLLRSLGIRLLYKILTIFQNKVVQKKRSVDIDNICAFINENLDEKLSVDFLSRTAGMSAAGLKKKFSRETGMSVTDYILRQKINKAKAELEHTGMTITEIAYSLDFSSSYHFTKTFKRYTGHTPSLYRSIGNM